MDNTKLNNKPFLNIDEQINKIIIDKNIIITDINEAKKILMSTSYYTLINGYAKLFSSGIEEKCIMNTTFDDIYGAYLFETDLYSILLKYILKVELSLKTKISYCISYKYGTSFDEYTNSKHYNKNKIKELQIFKSSAQRAIGIKANGKYYTPKDSGINHYYIEQYGRNKVPPWILVNGLSLGVTIHWYRALKMDCKKFIASSMTEKLQNYLTSDEQLEFFIKSLNNFLDARNAISHNRRLIYNNLTNELPSTILKVINDNKILSKSMYNEGIGKKGTYSIILALYLLSPNNYELSNLHQELSILLNSFNSVRSLSNGRDLFSSLGLPVDIDNRINLLYNMLINKN